jgi:hypothetical protein
MNRFAGAAFLALLALQARAAPPTAEPQWIDITASPYNADPTDTADATSAISAAIAAAISGGEPLYLPKGTYRVSAPLTIDFAGEAASGFRLISDGATLDGRTIASGPTLEVECSGGTPTSPANCFYFKEEGTLFIEANTVGAGFIFGKADFSDAQNSAKIDHLVVTNASTGASATGCTFNYVLDSDIFAVCNSAGSGAGIGLEQVQFSTIAGSATASGPGGRSLVLENGYDFSNTFKALDLEVSPICLSITTPHNGLNTFVSPYFNCTTAVSATASLGNTLLNPNYGGDVVNYGPLSTGISVLGPGSRNNWLFPTAAAYTAAPIDDGLSVSSYNAPGAALAVTLPAVASVNSGWSMGFATDNGNGMTVAVPDAARIVSGGKNLASIVLGAGNYEYVRLQSDGNNWRVLSMSRNTRLANGFEPPPWPSNWLYPSTSGYAATPADNGNTLSSFNASGGLTVTLPSTTGLPNGWSMGFATDNGHGLTVEVNGSSGGHIVFPGSGALTTNVTMANGFPGQVAYDFMVLQYDDSGNFRIVSALPATTAAVGMLGASGITRFSFPSSSNAYLATASDNGNMISSYNSPSSFMAVTLPATGSINQGWTIGVIEDNGKVMSIQVNGTAGGAILLPGTKGAVTSFSLATNTAGAAMGYEAAVLEFDGANFRVMAMTPNSAAELGMQIPSMTPSSSSAPCQTAELAQDPNYLYVCTAPNAWKRAALSAF